MTAHTSSLSAGRFLGMIAFSMGDAAMRALLFPVDQKRLWTSPYLLTYVLVLRVALRVSTRT